MLELGCGGDESEVNLEGIDGSEASAKLHSTQLCSTMATIKIPVPIYRSK